jgi:ABC-2 type transport system ATP-binding protein
MARPDRKERIQEILELVKLEAKKDTLVKKLSGGMKRRLEIGRGLMTRPIVLFLDEPTIGLDPQTRMRMWDYIKTVNDEGTTIFLTTHYMDEADNLSDRISIIDHGKIIASGKPWELKNALGEDLIYLETGDNTRAKAIISDLVNVSGVRDKGKGILITTDDDGTKVLPRLIEEIMNNGISVITVNLKKPSMDDVFVHFTGRDLRDDKPGKVPTTFRRK